MTRQKPNILIVMTDHFRGDLTFKDSNVPLPNIQRLAKEGVRFTNAYTVSAHCCPARASLMTGVYPSKHGIVNNVGNGTALRTGLDSSVETWSKILKADGYNMSYTGKWHVESEKGPETYGWKTFGKVNAVEKNNNSLFGADKPSRKDLEKVISEGVFVERDGWDPMLMGGKKKKPFSESHEYQGTIKAIEELKSLAKKKNPWCLFVSWVGPHDPYTPYEPFASMFDPKKIKLPPNFRDSFKDRPVIYRRQREVFDKLSEKDVKKAIAYYYGFCAELDYMFGMILEELDGTGQRDNTIVVFLADHGDMLGEHGMFLKGIPAFEGAYKIPLIIRWPKGIKKNGKDVASIARILDLGPTLLDAAGARKLKPSHGKSLLPLLTGKEKDGKRKEMYCQMSGVELYYTQRVMRDGKYKYVFNGFDYDELYDLQKDPHEKKNLINSPKLKKLKRQLLLKLWDWAEKTEDVVTSRYPLTALVPVGPWKKFRKKEK